MLYHFYITIHKTKPQSNSIWKIRAYESPEINELDLKNIQYVMEQAVQARGELVDGVGQVGVYISDSYPSWEESVPAYKNGEFTTQNARVIAQQILIDLDGAKYEEGLFMDTTVPFALLDFEKFSYIDESTDNSNLKVAIGKKVYLRGERDRIYVYQGRPNNEQIRNNQTIIKMKTKVWATDLNVIAVDDFSLTDYSERIEAFPLPSQGNATKGLGNNKYFAREKTTRKVVYEGIGTVEIREEALGTTEEQAQKLLALELAFRDILGDEPESEKSVVMDLIPLHKKS